MNIAGNNENIVEVSFKMSPPKGLTLDEKIILGNDERPKMSQREAVTELGVPESSLRKMLIERTAISTCKEPKRKRNRSGEAPAVETALRQWMDPVRQRSLEWAH